MTPADITALRDRLGLTYDQFAARVGMTGRTVRYWEQGAKTPGGAATVLLERMAAAAVKAKAKATQVTRATKATKKGGRS